MSRRSFRSSFTEVPPPNSPNPEEGVGEWQFAEQAASPEILALKAAELQKQRCPSPPHGLAKPVGLKKTPPTF